MAQRKRRTIEERIADAQEKLKHLIAIKESGSANSKPLLTKESPGMSEFLQQLDVVINENKVKAAEVILLVAKIKRTGLKLTKKSPG